MYRKFFKRFFDVVLSACALIVLSPVLLVVAVLVRVKLGSPVIFCQERPGKDEKIFKMYKFRSMLPPQTRTGQVLSDSERLEMLNCGREAEMLSDEERLTSFGRFLRASSLDELPELLNILKGDMSLVGPRPLSTLYLPYYTEEERERHSVLPGLTGLAQVNGRNAISWEARFHYDVAYARNLSIWMDLKIIIRTILIVVKRNDIGQGEERPEAFHIYRQRENQERMTKV